MKLEKLKKQPWFNGAAVACIGVAFYVLLTHFSTVLSAVGAFLGNFRVVFLGLVFAYLLNPIANFISSRVLKKMRSPSRRWMLSVVIAVAVTVLVLLLLLVTLIPQLVTSVAAFSDNIDEYADSVIGMLKNSFLERFVNEEQLMTLSQNALNTIISFVRSHAGQLLSSVADSGKSIISTVIALILAIYLLMDKRRVLSGWWRLVRTFFDQKRTFAFIDFCLHCDTILISYLTQTLLDSLIVGAVNAAFMLLCGMQYIGLVSVVVAVTNLIPNFGPVIGAVIGGFVLFLVNPLHALMFLIFTVLLQFADAYILKPKLFASSLGVSGLLILVASIVLGNMFGVIGMLLAIPIAAILSFIYRDYILPAHEKRRAQCARTGEPEEPLPGEET